MNANDISEDKKKNMQDTIQSLDEVAKIGRRY